MRLMTGKNLLKSDNLSMSLYITKNGIHVRTMDKIVECKANFDKTLVVNNQNKKESKEIKYNGDIKGSNTMPDSIIINGDNTVVKRNNERVILRKSKEDEMNLEYAFLYGYFLLNSGMSKTKASEFLKSIRDNEQK